MLEQFSYNAHTLYGLLGLDERYVLVQVILFKFAHIFQCLHRSSSGVQLVGASPSFGHIFDCLRRHREETVVVDMSFLPSSAFPVDCKHALHSAKIGDGSFRIECYAAIEVIDEEGSMKNMADDHGPDESHTLNIRLSADSAVLCQVEWVSSSRLMKLMESSHAEDEFWVRVFRDELGRILSEFKGHIEKFGITEFTSNDVWRSGQVGTTNFAADEKHFFLVLDVQPDFPDVQNEFFWEVFNKLKGRREETLKEDISLSRSWAFRGYWMLASISSTRGVEWYAVIEVIEIIDKKYWL